MRIISGRYKGRIINPPRNLRARPTTDFAKENLFNVLTGMVDIEECDVLDLFAGTGSVSYEFASRGARNVTAVEINAVHYTFIRRTASELGFANLYPVKANVFNYLRACTRKFDIIFSDAPYDLSGSEEVISLVFERGLLRSEGETTGDGSVSEGGLLVFEHSKGHDFSTHPRFLQTRSYGSVQFTLFGAESE
jgi:16S rRNA (guanine(966)-N(2))-methyltransferase RsmD